jgi:hypothetical protein
MDLSDLSFKELVIDAGCSGTFKISDLPAGAVPVWFDVPDELADSFVFTRVLVGLNSQLSSTAAVPAALFARGAPLDELLVDSVRTPHRSLEISVTNLSSRPMPFACSPIFSDEDSRLARYRRARVVGLGVSTIAPLGNLNVVVEPQLRFVPDRLFVPRAVLERVDVEGLEVREFDVARSAYRLIEAVPPRYLTREKLEGDGVFHLGPSRSVGPRECLTVIFRNRTDSPVDVAGAVLGGDPLS